MSEERSPVPYIPGLAGVPCAQSAVSFIDGQVGLLEYRGYRIEELSERSTFEETAYLLWFGELPTKKQLERFRHDLTRHRRLKYKVIDLLKCLPDSGHPMDALDCAVAALGMFYPADHVEDEKERYHAAVRILAKVPTIVAAYHRLRTGDEAITPRDDLDFSSNYLYMMNGVEPDPHLAEVLDKCLILHAEHTMNASTFAARVTASTLADPYSVVSSAIGTLTGPLHGGANEEVLHMLREIKTVDAVRPWATERVAAKKKVSGFGHREYKVKDPRANVLQKLAIELFDRFGHTPMYQVAIELEKVMAELVGHKGVYPNVDYYSGIVYSKMDIPTDLFTPIFAISRTAGWLAHWLEQIKDNRIFRPTQVYTGVRERKYRSLSERKVEEK